MTVLAVGWVPSTLTVLVVVLFGAALGGGFAMGLALLSEYAADGNASTRLTAMAFSVTYLTASLGPLVAGALLDALRLVERGVRDAGARLPACSSRRSPPCGASVRIS